jgi:hypothetical protein
MFLSQSEKPSFAPIQYNWQNHGLHGLIYNSQQLLLERFILREKHKVRFFESKLLRISGQKRDKVTWEWRKLHKQELHDLYTSSLRVIK